MISGPSGFYNAPIIKGLMFLTTGLTVLAQVSGIRSKLAVTHDFQLWRLFTSQLFFTSPGEAVLGLLLLYHFRLFERQMGSNKFASFSMVVYGLSALIQLSLLVTVPSRFVPCGPYAMIFACLVQYYFEIPSSYRFRLCGVGMSDKVFTYLLGFQLSLANLPASFVGMIAGLTAGAAYRHDALPLQRLQVPQRLRRMATRWLLPIFQSAPATHLTTSSSLNQVAAPAVPPSPAAVHASPISDVAVAQLMDIGFSREAAIHSLNRTNNNVQLATNLLLDGS